VKTRTNNKAKSIWPHAGNVRQKAFNKIMHFSLIKAIEDWIDHRKHIILKVLAKSFEVKQR
jgi:hypothetical protein